MTTGQSVRARPTIATFGARAWLALLAAAAVLGFMVERVVAIVADAGHYIIPIHDLGYDYTAGALWAVALGLSIFVWPVRVSDRRWLLAIWTAKVLVTLGFMLVYESHYDSLDAIGYFQASVAPSLDWSTVRLGNGSNNIEAMAWLTAQVIPGSFHALKITFAMAGLTAVYLAYRTAVIVLGRETPLLLLGLALVPSVLFWSSILGKDPFALLGVSIFWYGLVRWHIEGRRRGLVWAILGAFLAGTIRLWLLPILSIPALVLIILRLRAPAARVLAIGAGIAVLAMAAPVFKRQLFNETVVDLVATTNIVAQGWAKGGSAQITTPFSSVGAMVAFLPRGVFTALFRPLPGEVNNLFGILAGLEDVFLIALALFALSRVRRQALRDPLVASGLAFIAAWSGVYSFLSYQNLGTAVRFRLQVLPTLILLLLHIAYFGRGRDGANDHSAGHPAHE